MAPPVEVKTKRSRAGAGGRLEHVDGADHVEPRVEARVGDRAAHVDLGGQVEDAVGPEGLDRADSSALGVRDVELGPGVAPASSAPARFSRLPLERSSSTSTSSPRRDKASTRCEPMNPAPPVTTDFTRPRQPTRERAEGR